MKRFLGQIAILIGSIIIIAFSVCSLGIIFYHIINRDLLSLIASYNLEGWISFLLSILTILTGILYCAYSLRIISLGRASKNSLFISFVYIFLEISKFCYIHIMIPNTFSTYNLFFTFSLIKFVGYFIQVIGFSLNYHRS